VDLLLAGAALAALDLLAFAGMRALRGVGVGGGASAWFLAFVLVANVAAFWGYGVLFEWIGDGRTPGKRLFGLRVVMDGGYSVTLGASMLRNLVRFLDLQPGFTYGVGLVAALVSRQGRRLGDAVAGTLVVRERVGAAGAPSPAARPAEGAHGAAPAPRTTLLDDDRFAVLERFAARRSALPPERARALAEQLAGSLRPALDALAREEASAGGRAGGLGRAPARDGDPAALGRLLARERAARARGAAVGGARGAGRARHTLVAEGAERWAAFAARLAVARRRGLAALPEAEVSRFAADYRDAAADLARLTTALDGREDADAFRLGRLVAEGHNLLYRRARVRPGAAGRYLARTVPAAVLGAWRPVALAAALLFGPMLVSAVSVARVPARAEQVLPEEMLRRAAGSRERARRGTGYIEDPELFRPLMAGGIVANNVQVTYVAFAAGVAAGLGTALLLLSNGVSIGAVFGLYASHGTLPLLLAFVAPHGVLELSAIAIAGGAGLLLGAAVLLPGARTRREALAANGRRAAHLLVASTLMLVAAGAIEGLVSPIPTWPLGGKLAVALATAVLLAGWLRLGRGGRAREAAPDAD
jgi:uncharacterized membrane protein SpoIIM required for sporulation/uncharacterized RDD family membrane protein YckC